MKLRSFLVVLMVFAVMVCTQSAFAQPAATPLPPSTSVDGRAGAGVSWNFGNNVVGGWSGGAALGAFEAQGLCIASGDADANGKGIGMSTTGPNSASSVAKGVVNSRANADGSVLEKTSVSGTAQQGNWAGTGVDGNFAHGGNTTQAQYDGSDGNKAAGSGVADGKTNVSATSTPTSAQADVTTRGDSFGDMYLGRDGTGATSASGNGNAAAMSSAGGGADGKYAGASLSGDAAYNAAGRMSASGSLVVTGNTSSQIGPTSAQAAASVFSAATASGPHCGSGGSGCGGGH